MNKKLYFILCILLLSSALKAQIIVDDPVKIIQGLQDSSIQAFVTPEFNIGTIEKIFDGNPYTKATVLNSDSVIVTLLFNNPIKISESKIFVWNNGKWFLEIADNLNDLNNKTGSYNLAVNNRDFSYFIWDSVSFNQIEAKAFRLSIFNLQDSTTNVGEWGLERKIQLTSLKIIPDPPRVIPGTELQLDVRVLDEEGNVYPFEITGSFDWFSDNQTAATINNAGVLTGVALGTSTIRVVYENSISGEAVASVEQDFISQKAPTKIVKVALVIQDPIISQWGNIRIHQKWSWDDPFVLTEQTRQDLNAASDSVVIFQIVETYNDQNIFTILDSSYMTLEQIAYYFSNSQTLYTELKYIAETQNRIHYDYNGMVDFYDFDTKRNNGEIDEVWVYAFPFGGMYESQLMGTGAFWWNSPPLAHEGLNKILSVMGWNYERGVAEALHSVGHRFESAIWHAFGRWNLHAPKLNDWELFTSIEKELPGKSHVGNIHFPPNGTSDYDYDNPTNVTTYADNWKRFPYILNQTRIINCQEWNCDHREYMRWWFRHIPRYVGVKDSILNNWWHYAVEYYEAVELAHYLMGVNDKDGSSILPGEYDLKQNYPNPFNPSTTIEYTVGKRSGVNIMIFDILGRQIKTLVDEEKDPGLYSIDFNGAGLASGVYICRMKSSNFVEASKLVLIK